LPRNCLTCLKRSLIAVYQLLSGGLRLYGLMFEIRGASGTRDCSPRAIWSKKVVQLIQMRWDKCLRLE
jgi:hypothetical protein